MGYVNGVCMVFIVSKKGSLHPSLKDCQVLSCIYSDGVIVASYLIAKNISSHSSAYKRCAH